MRRRRDDVAVVTDLAEPLVVQHRRRIRVRLVAMAVWIAGWVVAGMLWRDGWLATAVLLGSGPGIWLLWWLAVPRHDPGRRQAVRTRGPRALPAADRPSGASGEHAG
ncbi:MAG: DUF3099 domain-containing protein [Actinomycetota bacterium]|nr:DUF3099 domain-containing protein [Actinomycetota bacterium]